MGCTISFSQPEQACVINPIFISASFTGVFVSDNDIYNHVICFEGVCQQACYCSGGIRAYMGNSLYYIDSTIHTEKVLSENETEREASIDGLYLYNDFSTIENLNDWSLCTMLCCIAVGAKNMWGRWKHVL